MNIYLIRMEHPDGPLWNTHVLEHVRYLQRLIAEGRVLASGPIKGGTLRAGFIIARAESREEIDALVHGDPFSREDLICGLSVEQWDPLFGLLAEESSKQVPPELAALG